MAKKKKEKKKKRRALKVILIIICVIVVICCAVALANYLGVRSNEKFIESLDVVEYDNQLVPTLDDDGCYTFTTDDDFRIMQLTDIHIGAGFNTIKKDRSALNAIAAMVAEEKPDLVVLTGDMIFSMPYRSFTFNNMHPSQLVADLMEHLGVYWCVTFGNHDSEGYNLYSRESIAALYSDEKYAHSLFDAGPEDIDGEGNYVINVKNSEGEITQSLFMLDSGDYTDDDFWGFSSKYGTVRESQVNWYADTLQALKEENDGIMPKSLVFLHIPMQEYEDAWDEYMENDYQDTADVQYYYGKAGELGRLICCSEENYGLFDTALELGSTQGFFCGHDHVNNFSVDYKGIRLSYSYSVDYFAYSGISKYGSQRGCTMIDVYPDSTFDCHLENYYQDKYEPVLEKETVSMEDYAK